MTGFTQMYLQYLIDVLPNGDWRYGNVYCTLSLASPAISPLCLLSWHAGLINIGLISCTACWPLIIPMILLAPHCGNPVQLINNSGKRKQHSENMSENSLLRKATVHTKVAPIYGYSAFFHCISSLLQCFIELYMWHTHWSPETK